MAAVWSGIRRILRAMFYRQDTSIFAVLKEHNFRNLWIGQMISFVGDSLAYNTLIFAILSMAKDEGLKAGQYIGPLAVLSSLPPLALGMFAGTIADRVNRKYLMITADILRGFITLGFLLVTKLDQVWIFYTVSIGLSAVSVFFFPARTAMMPLILDKKQLLSANAMSQLTYTLSFVVGAALAGVLVGQFDTMAPAFIADSLSFFVSAYFISRITISGKVIREVSLRVKAGGHRGLQQIVDMYRDLVVGVRYVLTDRVMRGVLISFLAMMLGLGAANVTFVPLLVNELGMKEEGIGLVRFSQTAGIILGSAAIAAVATRYKSRDLIGLSMVAFGVTTMMVAVTPTYPLMVAVLFLVGLVISPPQIVAPTLIQRHVPSEKLGRAGGAQNTIVTVANITSMGAAGFLMDHIGARTVFLSAGLIIFAAGFVSWWVLRGVEDLSDEDQSRPEKVADSEEELVADFAR